MAATQTDQQADRELKARHRRMWGLGDYPAMVRDFLTPLGPTLVDIAGIRPGERVLDVAAGTGNAAIVAAERGARVVASDLTPELFDAGRARAKERGVELEWVEADAEALPFDTESFDVVMSCIGAMFAPMHEAVADELVRVCRPGGTIALLNWTPDSIVGDLFRAMKPFMPAPPEGAKPPVLWGDEDHVRDLFGDRVAGLEYERHTLEASFPSAHAQREFFKEHYGPTVLAYRRVADDPEQTRLLDRALLDAFERREHEHGHWVYDYAVIVATRR
jgi:ubiquinone/menaquinone biosynthesis C-methylase UbiE